MAITNARLQMRRGYEQDYDPAMMMPGEWAVSLDTKYVRMCFAPGECLRMATYEAFEQDMAEILRILEECRDIRTAVELIRDNITDAELVIEDYVAQAKQYRDEAEQFRNEAEVFAPEGYSNLVHAVAENTVKIDTIIDKAELNIKNTASGETIHLTDSADSKVVEFGLHGKAEQNGEPTPDAPVDIEVAGASGSVEVKSVGKNLLNYTSRGGSVTIRGITYTENNMDKTIMLNGTAETGYLYDLLKSVNKLPDGFENNAEYIVSCGLDGLNMQVYGTNDGGATFTYLTSTIDASPRFNTENFSGLYVRYNITQGQVFSNTITYPMIRLASDTDDTYEPYTETTSTISTPDGLCGINGVCDEVVKYADGSGKRIQRIGKAVFDGSDDEGWTLVTADGGSQFAITISNNGNRKLLCTHFRESGVSNWSNVPDLTYMVHLTIFENVRFRYDAYTTVDEWRANLQAEPMEVLYQLATPIITDLTAEEIAEIEKLHTFYPVTNISNDADCGMAVTYLADSKNYIDNQLAIQKAQQEESLLNMLLLMPEDVQASMIENDTNNLLNEAEV